jgi:DNA-binding MarR family transcriptional regulator
LRAQVVNERRQQLRRHLAAVAHGLSHGQSAYVIYQASMDVGDSLPPIAAIPLLQPKKDAQVSSSPRRRTGHEPWLSAAELQAWRAFMRVQMRMNYEMNRQLQSDTDLSLADYHVLNALTDAPGGRLQVSDLAALIGWERSRASHQLRRLCERGLAQRVPSEDDGRATDAILTKAGREAINAAAPGHVALVRRLFFDPLPAELLAPLTAALEHIHVHMNLNSSLPPVPW